MNRSNQSYLFGSYPTPISSLHYSNITFTVLHPLLPFRAINTTTSQQTHTHTTALSHLPFLSFPFHSHSSFSLSTTPAQSDT